MDQIQATFLNLFYLNIRRGYINYTYLLDRSVHEGVMQRNRQDTVEDGRQANIPDFVFASIVFNNQLSLITNTADLNDEINDLILIQF